MMSTCRMTAWVKMWKMMKKAGINTVRIAGVYLSTCEPQPGVF
ncbi:MAG: hypothetical protein ACLTER_27825 [Ruminococcus sp.]